MRLSRIPYRAYRVDVSIQVWLPVAGLSGVKCRRAMHYKWGAVTWIGSYGANSGTGASR